MKYNILILDDKGQPVPNAKLVFLKPYFKQTDKGLMVATDCLLNKAPLEGFIDLNPLIASYEGLILGGL